MATLKPGNRRDAMPDPHSKPTSPNKKKMGGFRNTLRWIFGRSSTRDWTSMPNPAVYPRHDPEELIASAKDVKVKLVALSPTHRLLHTSGLNSHPPHQASPNPPCPTDTPAPPQPERLPPERPTRPRRTSVPSLILNRQDMESVSAAVTGLGLQDAQEQTFDPQNIGFAVANGSNSKRRSRSVSASRDSEHRMSPIQGRRWRRRSDEIRYWRPNSDLTSLGIKGLDSPEMKQKDDDDLADEDKGGVGEFDFGLPGDNIHDQRCISLEERIVTLEIKLMDFEYAIAKLQSRSISPSKCPRQHTGMAECKDSIDGSLSSDRAQAPIEPSPSIPQEIPPMVSLQWVKDIIPKPRPTSVVTTLSPGYSGYHALPQRDSLDRSTRSSLMGLTIDHYPNFITQLRNEQSTSQRLEQQVSILQGRLDTLSPSPSSYSHAHSLSQHSQPLSPLQRRQAFVNLRAGTQMRHKRQRSSSYSTNETDTKEDTFNDIYVAPNAALVDSVQGEHERGAFDRVAGVEEGKAF